MSVEDVVRVEQHSLSDYLNSDEALDVFVKKNRN